MCGISDGAAIGRLLKIIIAWIFCTEIIYSEEECNNIGGTLRYFKTDCRKSALKNVSINVIET